MVGALAGVVLAVGLILAGSLSVGAALVTALPSLAAVGAAALSLRTAEVNRATARDNARAAKATERISAMNLETAQLNRETAELGREAMILRAHETPPTATQSPIVITVPSSEIDADQGPSSQLGLDASPPC